MATEAQFILGKNLLGMGNPLLDISANVDQAYLDRYGFKMGNAVLCEDDKTKECYADMIKNFKVDYIAGGATQNSIRVAQWILKDHPGCTDFVGCVGKDDFGKQLAEAAAADGVRTHYLIDSEEATGSCAVAVMDKERSLCANLAAANKYKISHIQSEDIARDTYLRSTHIYSAGFFLTVSPDTMEMVAEHCNQTGKVFAVNLSAPFIVEFFTEPLKKVLARADYVFGNESEAEAWGKKHEYTDMSVSNIALEISKLPHANGQSRTVVITQGGDPTVVARDGKVTEYPVPKLDPSKIVDSNGAGDSFVGGFLAALMSGRDMEGCVKAGTEAAAIILGVSGCDTRGLTPPAL
jgi:adenosine kinase